MFCLGYRLIGCDNIDGRPMCTQGRRKNVACLLCARQEDMGTRRQNRTERIHDCLCAELLRHNICLDPVGAQTIPCRRTDGSNFCIAECARILSCVMKSRKEMLHTVDTGKDHPVIVLQFSDGRIQSRVRIGRRNNANHRCLDAGCTKCRQFLRQCRCLNTRACDKNAFSKKRTELSAVEPAQTISQAHHIPHNEDRGRSYPITTHHLSRLTDRRHVRLLIGTRPPSDKCCRSICGTPILDQIFRDLRKICHAHQKDQCIHTCCEMLPADVRLRFRRILVPRDHGKGNRNTSMCHRNTGIGRHADRGGDTGQDLKGYSTFQQNESLFPTAAKDERISALQTNDRLSLLRLVCEQDIDLLLSHCMMAGLLADIDPLCCLRHIGENTLIGKMVIDNNIRPFQALHRPHGQKARISGTRANKKHHSVLHAVIPISFKISRPPASRSSSARAVPRASACSPAPCASERQIRCPSTEAIIASMEI